MCVCVCVHDVMVITKTDKFSVVHLGPYSVFLVIYFVINSYLRMKILLKSYVGYSS